MIAMKVSVTGYFTLKYIYIVNKIIVNKTLTEHKCIG